MTALARPLAGLLAVQAANLLCLLRQPFSVAVRAIRIHNGRHALNRLSDRALKDIGLRRCDIDSVVQSLVDERPDLTRIRSPRGG